MEIKYFEFIKYLIRFNRQVYLDHNATTPVSDHVRHKMGEALKYHYGNPSSFYGMGRKSASLLEEAREHVANAIHAKSAEV
ncbi:MAG: aminotransferase class V-fold PLP-dependent enzyme, partial [Chloroflexota bacterium]